MEMEKAVGYTPPAAIGGNRIHYWRAPKQIEIDSHATFHRVMRP